MYQRWRILDILDTPPDLWHRSAGSDTVLEIRMSMDPTPPLSLEVWLEIMEEIENPPPMTSGRRATFERMRARRALLDDMEFPDDEVVGSTPVTSKHS
jgi:hypothetical protein